MVPARPLGRNRQAGKTFSPLYKMSAGKDGDEKSCEERLDKKEKEPKRSSRAKAKSKQKKEEEIEVPGPFDSDDQLCRIRCMLSLIDRVGRNL